MIISLNHRSIESLIFSSTGCVSDHDGWHAMDIKKQFSATDGKNQPIWRLMNLLIISMNSWMNGKFVAWMLVNHTFFEIFFSTGIMQQMNEMLCGI